VRHILSKTFLGSFFQKLIYTPENKSRTASLSLFFELSGLVLTQNESLEASTEQKSNKFSNLINFLTRVHRIFENEMNKK
jgi:hypothetical protein